MEIFGIIDFFDSKQIRRFSATALDKEVILQFISFDNFETHFFTSPGLRVEVLNSVIRIKMETEEKYYDSQTFDLTQRVLRAIKRLANRKSLQNEKEKFLEAITHKELSDYIGVSRQSITLTLNILKNEGKIKYDRNRITIINPK